jgi:hypothetical protein
MPALADVIPLSSRRPGPAAAPYLPADDQTMICSAIGMLVEQIAIWGQDSSAGARIFFYFRFHHYSVERWMSLLLAQETEDGPQLARQIDDAFQYVTSTAMLDNSGADRDGCRKKLNELTDNLRALLLIQVS